jgi:hypothetical protein
LKCGWVPYRAVASLLQIETARQDTKQVAVPVVDTNNLKSYGLRRFIAANCAIKVLQLFRQYNADNTFPEARFSAFDSMLIRLRWLT